MNNRKVQKGDEIKVLQKCALPTFQLLLPGVTLLGLVVGSPGTSPAPVSIPSSASRLNCIKKCVKNIETNILISDPSLLKINTYLEYLIKHMPYLKKKSKPVFFRFKAGW